MWGIRPAGASSCSISDFEPGRRPGGSEIAATRKRTDDFRRDYEANSPLQTVDRSAFESQSSIALETALASIAGAPVKLTGAGRTDQHLGILGKDHSHCSLRGRAAARERVRPGAFPVLRDVAGGGSRPTGARSRTAFEWSKSQ